MERSGIEEEEDIPLSLIATEAQHQKLLGVQVQDKGCEGRAGVTDGTDGDEDDRVDVWCFPEPEKNRMQKKNCEEE